MCPKNPDPAAGVFALTRIQPSLFLQAIPFFPNKKRDGIFCVLKIKPIKII